jgi:hypothetical protein
VKLWNSQPVEISRDDALHLCCGGKERINSCHPNNRTSVTNGKHFMRHSEDIKLFQVHTEDCNIHYIVSCNLHTHTHTFLMIHLVFERSTYFMLKEQMESTSDVMWQFGVPFQFYIFTTAIDCV